MSPGSLEKLSREARLFYDALPDTSPTDAVPQDRFTAVAKKLEESRNPVIVCGTDIVRENSVDLVADHASLLKAAGKKPDLFFIFPGPNAFGAALLSPAGGSVKDVIGSIEKGLIKALLLVESDPFWLFPDRERLAQALDRLKLLLVLDYLPSESMKRAHIALPTLTLFEKTGSSFINQEGRLQFASPIHEGGLPISRIGGGDHPPRIYQDHIPGGEARTARDILAELSLALSGAGKELEEQDLRNWLAQENPIFSRLASPAEEADGLRLVPDGPSGGIFSLKEMGDPSGGDGVGNPLECLAVDWTLGTEELSSYSRPIQQAEKAPKVLMNSGDASRFGLLPEENVCISFPGGPLRVELRVVDNMARGVLIIPRHRLLAWQKLKETPLFIAADRIKRI